ncbi:MAG: PEP-CTERM sorting domain-containing protein [Planctomycetota bacterium]
MKSATALAAVSAFCFASSATAQSFNIDFSFIGSGTLPASSFGGGANQPGMWTEETAGGTGFMTDINGNLTGATFNGGGFNEFLGGGDPIYEDLFRDRAAFDQTWSFVITDLQPGRYLFWLYGGPNGSGEFSITSNGLTENRTDVGAQSFNEYLVDVTAGNPVTFQSLSSAGDEGVTALQIVQIPEPSSLALLGLGGLIVCRRHRSQIPSYYLKESP